MTVIQLQLRRGGSQQILRGLGLENKYNREDGYNGEEVDIMSGRSLSGGFVPSSELLSPCSCACETSMLPGLFEMPVSFSKIIVQIFGLKLARPNSSPSV